ncbi:MAG: rod shape-determining protein MreC [Alteraurantiacibacter sp.]
MAPPSAQSGTNKRAQMGRFTGYVFASAGALIGALLLIISLWRPETFYGLRSMATDAAAPVGEAGAAGRTTSRGFFEAIAGYYNAGSKNAELEQEVEVARVRLAEAVALEQENARLKALLDLVEGNEEVVATGRLIGSTSSSVRRFGYLSAGRSDGVTVGMPVTSSMGLVGRILEAGRSTSRVLLLTDPESIVPVRRATDDVVAFAEGRADGSLRIRLINLGINPLEEGDIFVTSGAGGLFRPGVAVAMVSKITDDGAIGQLLSNPAATDFVMVQPIFEPEAILAAEQPPLAEQPVDEVADVVSDEE